MVVDLDGIEQNYLGTPQNWIKPPIIEANAALSENKKVKENVLKTQETWVINADFGQLRCSNEHGFNIFD